MDVKSLTNALRKFMGRKRMFYELGLRFAAVARMAWIIFSGLPFGDRYALAQDRPLFWWNFHLGDMQTTRAHLAHRIQGKNMISIRIIY
ncbi:MAG: hypothetical protein NTX50_29620 [Candidatus Sumerlaeota bacterium]|nr:hypothetical protein [Candidatus Sumerlaeota bacterium]